MAFGYLMVAFGWLAALLFIGVSAYKIVRLARLPVNVRWEVYPVPHESKEKRGYGGSYMEEMDWATRKRSSSPLPAILEIAAEVATLKRVREHNGYGIWPLSLAMHWGLYLYFGWLFLLVVGNAVNVAALSYLTVAVGLTAHILGAVGALGLVVKRATNRDLRPYTTRSNTLISCSSPLCLSRASCRGLVILRSPHTKLTSAVCSSSGRSVSRQPFRSVSWCLNYS
jgi:nitrate reductase gamma subunit